MHGERDGDVDEACAGTAGPGLTVGGGGRRPLSDERSPDQHIFCAADSIILSPGES